MLKVGMYIEYKWYAKMLSDLKFNQTDYEILNLIHKNLTTKSTLCKLNERIKNKFSYKNKW